MYKIEGYPVSYEALARKIRGNEKKDNNFFQNAALLYLKSLKPFYLEELLVLFVYRPLSFLIAFSLFKLPVSPNVITVLRGLGGILAGIFFAQGTYEYMVTGAVSLFVSNIFDCADGQLARMRGRISWIGAALDAVIDLVATFSIYAGVAFCLARTMPETGGLWYLLSGLAALSLVVHLNGFGLFRSEFHHYTKVESPEVSKSPCDSNETIKASKADNKAVAQKLLSVLKYIQIGLSYIQVKAIDKLKKIAFPRGYEGYSRLFAAEKTGDERAREAFKTSYKRNNQRLLQGFGTISTVSNLTTFVIAGTCGHLEWALYAILFGFNAYFVAIVMIQRISLKKQLAIAGIVQSR